MRKQDQLISLIKSLTQGEKKFFVQRCKSSGGEKSYLKLYELLLKQNTYEPDRLAAILGKSHADLANEKKYLEKNLLSALRQYHEDHPQLAVLNKIAEGVLLMERNLPQAANVAIKQSIRVAASAGIPPLAWHAHGLALTLCSDPFVSFNESAAQAKTHLQQMKLLAETISLSTDFEILNDEVFEAYSKRKIDVLEAHKSETAKLLKHPLLNRSYDVFQFQAYKYSLLSLLYARSGNVDAGIHANRGLVELYEKQPAIDLIGYWNALANLTQAIISSGDKQQYELWMQKLDSRYYRKLRVDASYIDSMLQQFRSVFSSGAYFRMLKSNQISADEVRVYCKKFSRNFTLEMKRIPSFHFVSTVYKVAACYLIVDDAPACIELLNRLFNESIAEANIGAYRNARLLFLMAHFSYGNYELLPSLAQSTANFSGKVSKSSPAVKMLLQYFSKPPLDNTVKQRRLWLNNLKQSVNKIRSQEDMKALLENLPLDLWLDMNY